MDDERKITDKQAADNGGAIDDRKFRKYRRLILVVMIAAVLCVIGFLVSGLVRSLYGGDEAKTTDDKLKKDDKFAAIKADRKIVLAPGVDMEMILVKAGSFKMSLKDDANWKDEKAHDVTLENDFCIGRTEVTQAQYQAVMGWNPAHFREDGAKRPVEMVSWDDAMAFCARLNALGKAPAGWEFALPTEAQWEFAARGGVKNRNYSRDEREIGCKYSGSDELKEVGWYGDSDSDNTGSDGIKGATHPVATKAANELGIYDMSGNVWEWCLDDYLYDARKVLPEERLEIRGVSDGRPVSCQYRTVRGGSWSKDARYCRITTRYYYKKDLRLSNVGFRVVLTRTPVVAFDALKAAAAKGDVKAVRARTAAKEAKLAEELVDDLVLRKTIGNAKVVSCVAHRRPFTIGIKLGVFVDTKLIFSDNAAALRIKSADGVEHSVGMVKENHRWKVAEVVLTETPVSVFNAWKAAVLRGDLAEVEARTVAKDRKAAEAIVTLVKGDPKAKKSFEKFKVVSSVVNRPPVTFKVKVGVFADQTILIPAAVLEIDGGDGKIRTVRMVKAGRRWKVVGFKL